MKRVIKVDSGFALNALISHGISRKRQGDIETARICFEQALEIDPKNDVALLWLAFLSTNPFDAKELISRVLEYNPEHQHARTYYQIVQQRCTELENILNNSYTLIYNQPRLEVPKIGQFLLDKGYISETQLRVGIKFQKMLDTSGRHEKLGEVLLSFGYLTSIQLNHALEELGCRPTEVYEAQEIRAAS
jgi:tetratricopeptide (TPR) repeat protein